MRTIKLSTPWAHNFYYNRTKGGLGIVGDFKFEIDNDCSEADYWVVWGDLPVEQIKCKVKVPTDNVFYITDEAHDQKHFDENFLNQFAHIFTLRTDINSLKKISIHELNTWLMDVSYDKIYETSSFSKSKVLSIVSSNLTDLPGHKNRFAFVNKLMGHFKGRLDVYGRGFIPIENKFDALAPYKYSIAIENNVIPGYFTEKLTECFLVDTFPIYFGCPDIENYFDKNAMMQIDINDFEKSVLAIERLLKEDPYDKKIALLKSQKKKYLEEYHIFEALVNYFSSKEVSNPKKQWQTVYAHRIFSNKSILKRIIEKLLK